MIIPTWQRRREEFNHQWLKNDLMMALDSWPTVLYGTDEDPDMESNFITKYVKTWPTKQREALALIDDFENLMSPKTLFHDQPLSNCDEYTKKWLGDLVHQLWLVRCAVTSLIADARASLDAVAVAHVNLIMALKSCKDITKAKEMRPFGRQFEEFRAACKKLETVLEQFPREILAV